MTEVKFYDGAEDSLLKFVVIIAKTKDRFIFCKHQKRNTYELPGGHREPGEEILTAAKRELNEETGAVDFTITPICVYSVTETAETNESTETFGMLYIADIFSFEPLHNEIETIILTDRFVDCWTYPLIQPVLLKEAQNRGYL